MLCVGGYRACNIRWSQRSELRRRRHTSRLPVWWRCSRFHGSHVDTVPDHDGIAVTVTVVSLTVVLAVPAPLAVSLSPLRGLPVALPPTKCSPLCDEMQPSM